MNTGLKMTSASPARPEAEGFLGRPDHGAALWRNWIRQEAKIYSLVFAKAVSIRAKTPATRLSLFLEVLEGERDRERDDVRSLSLSLHSIRSQ